jgi:hypothetical protein
VEQQPSLPCWRKQPLLIPLYYFVDSNIEFTHIFDPASPLAVVVNSAEPSASSKNRRKRQIKSSQMVQSSTHHSSEKSFYLNTDYNSTGVSAGLRDNTSSVSPLHSFLFPDTSQGHAIPDYRPPIFPRQDPCSPSESIGCIPARPILLHSIWPTILRSLPFLLHSSERTPLSRRSWRPASR